MVEFHRVDAIEARFGQAGERLPLEVEADCRNITRLEVGRDKIPAGRPTGRNGLGAVHRPLASITCSK